MKDKLTKRVLRILSGSFHNAVLALEKSTPETVMQGCIQEVDVVLAQSRDALGKSIAKVTLIEANIKNVMDKTQSLNNQAKIALQENRKDLAEAALEQVLALEQEQNTMQKSLQKYIQRKVQHEQNVAALKQKHDAMVEELARLKSNLQDTSLSEDNFSNPSNTAESAISTFDRILKINGGHLSDTDINKYDERLIELGSITRNKEIQARLLQMQEAME